MGATVTTICIDMGIFIRTVTAQLDDGLHEKKGCVAVSLGADVVLFRRDWLDNILYIINGLFYKCYGGWRLEIDIHQNGIYTGRVAFVPAN